MEYSKDYLIKKAIKKFENMEETLNDCMEMLVNLNNEREVIRYLLYLGFEKQ
ncbi:MAG: hypothetical protein PHC64_07385 [Candidatus Gastranaerophilales bacterium]|nr:hypothetical protein [Candidatus Gastranaerophilales bacterium]